MDKLKKVLNYKFWILLGLALLLPTVAWAVTRSGLLKETETRTKEIEGKFGGLKFGPQDPNETWVGQSKKLNDEQQRAYYSAWLQLWTEQRANMVWLDGLSTDPFVNPPSNRDRELYRQRYPEEVQQVWLRAEPIENDPEKGKLSFPYERMPAEDFGTLPPTPDQMKNGQEDLWLLGALLDCIAVVNEPAQAQYDSTIREIYQIRLLGGAGKPIPVSGIATGLGAGGPAASGSPQMSGSPAPLAMSMTGLPTGVTGLTPGPAGADFNPADEFGTDEDKAAPAGPATTMTSGSPLSGSPASTQPPRKRYVEDNTMWKTRAFYLKVAVDHRKAPDLLVSLANCRWPVRIVRVQQVDLLPEDLTDAPGSGISASGMSSSGMSSPSFGNMSGMSAPPPALFPGSTSGMSTSGGNATASSAAALNDPMLAVMTISGLITIYKPPPADKVGGPVPGSPAPPGMTAPGAAPAPGTAPAPGAAPVPAPGTAPAPAIGPAVAPTGVAPVGAAPRGGGPVPPSAPPGSVLPGAPPAPGPGASPPPAPGTAPRPVTAPSGGATAPNGGGVAPGGTPPAVAPIAPAPAGNGGPTAAPAGNPGAARGKARAFVSRMQLADASPTPRLVRHDGAIAPSIPVQVRSNG